ncbi:MAG: SPFH domain-containing protein [Candidatus Altiarchaeota archaeon]|nr:SPFH domain-containing protein [Candidatus Altiarchaeota archaeon]
MATKYDDVSGMFSSLFKSGVGLFVGFILLIVVLSVVGDILVIIPAGFVGVDYTAWGGISMNSVRNPGWSFKLPLVQSVYLVQTARDTINLHPGGDDIAISAPTKEGLIVTSDVSVLYKTRASAAPSIVQELTTEYRKGTLIPEIRAVIREVTGNMSVTDIYGPGRERLQQESFVKLKPLFEKDGFIIEDVLVREVAMPTDIASAIEDKQAMEQQAFKKQYELELTQKEAERLKIQGEGIANQQVAIAEGEAKAKIAIARGEAESKIIVAKAEAEALKTVADTIKANPNAYSFKQLQIMEELYTNPNTNFVALPSNQMIYQLPESVGKQ